MLWGRVTYEMMESTGHRSPGDIEAPPALREAVKLETAEVRGVLDAKDFRDQ